MDEQQADNRDFALNLSLFGKASIATSVVLNVPPRSAARSERSDFDLATYSRTMPCKSDLDSNWRMAAPLFAQPSAQLPFSRFPYSVQAMAGVGIR
jgi:hypothetical protein